MNRYASALYQFAPVWGQNLMLTGFSWLLDRERYGGRFEEFRSLLEKTERFSDSELQAYQDERLCTIVTNAYSKVPFYKRRWDEHKVKPSDIRGVADLPKLPLLTRDDIRDNFDELCSLDVNPKNIKTGHTSGTTGTPLTVGYDADTTYMAYAALDRHYRWAGCRLAKDGDRIAVARGNVIVPLDQKSPPFWRMNRWHNQLLLSSFHLSKQNLPAYFEALAEFRPDVVDGYPSTLYVLAKYLQSRGETFPVRAVISSSETLYDFQRQVIEASFKTRVFDYYALAERVVFSGECERHEGHHLAVEYGVAEVVDEDAQPVQNGVVGKLVGTSLHNKVMPLIRYVTNDMTSLRTQSCSCGRRLPIMDDVTTKAEDLLTLKDGRLISPSVLTHPFKPLDCIEGSQIVQTDPSTVIVRLIPGATYTQEHTDHLIIELTARLGADVKVEVQMVDRLEQKANGKFKWVISHVPLGI